MKVPQALDTNHIRIRPCKHGTFLYNTHDLYVGRSLDTYGEWTEAEIQFLKKYIKPGNIILDVGAYIGTHTVPFSKFTGSIGHVYAIEPQKLIFYQLCANIAINNLTNVSALNFALSDQRSQINLPITNPTRENNFGAKSLRSDPSGVPTAILSLDELNLTKIDLVKIDVETMESQVIRGGAKTISKLKPILYVENNTVEHSRQLLETLERLGYQSYWHINPYYNSKNYFKVKKNIFENILPEANLFCFHQSSKHHPPNLPKVIGPNDNFLQAINRHHL